MKINGNLHSLSLRCGSQVVIDSSCGGTVHSLHLCPLSVQDSVLHSGRTLEPSAVTADADRIGESSEKAAATQAVTVMCGDNSIEQPALACETELFRGRILLPFNDRILKGQYQWKGKHMQLMQNDTATGDAIHGFLYRKSMTVSKKPLPRLLHEDGLDGVDISGGYAADKSSNNNESNAGNSADNRYKNHSGNTARNMTLTLETTLDAEEGYPFSLQVWVRYVLEQSRFSLHLYVQNIGGAPAPLALGWHPYFCLPSLSSSSLVDSLRLSVPATQYYAVDAALIPTGECIPVQSTPYDFCRKAAGAPLGSRELDIAYADMDRQRPVILQSDEFAVHLSMGGAFRALQVYIPPDRASIALEPVSGPANVFNQPKLGLIVVEPKQTISAQACVMLRG